jgi:hypothetical protein
MRASGTKLSSVTVVSPAWIGATSGAGSAEHGCAVVVPGGLGGSVGQSHYTAEKTSPVTTAGLIPLTVKRPPQARNVPTATLLGLDVKRAPFAIPFNATCCEPAYAVSNVGAARGNGGSYVTWRTEGGLGSSHIDAHARTCWPSP